MEILTNGEGGNVATGHSLLVLISKCTFCSFVKQAGLRAASMVSVSFLYNLQSKLCRDGHLPLQEVSKIKNNKSSCLQQFTHITCTICISTRRSPRISSNRKYVLMCLFTHHGNDSIRMRKDICQLVGLLRRVC